MAPSPEGPLLDIARLVVTLDHHGVEYLLVGGVAPQALPELRRLRDAAE